MNNVIIQCDQLLAVEINGFVYGDGVPAVSLGPVAELDDPQYSVPDLVEDNDDPVIINSMEDLCMEGANVLDRE